MQERRAAVWIGALCAALLAAFAPVSPARAHASLVKAVPADGAALPPVPPALTLTFSEPVSPLAASAWIAAIVAAGLIALPVSVGLQGLDALALPLFGLTQKAVWAEGLQTAYGSTAIVAACALFAGLFSLAAPLPRLARGLS